MAQQHQQQPEQQQHAACMVPHLLHTCGLFFQLITVVHDASPRLCGVSTLARPGPRWVHDGGGLQGCWLRVAAVAAWAPAATAAAAAPAPVLVHCCSLCWSSTGMLHIADSIAIAVLLLLLLLLVRASGAVAAAWCLRACVFV